MVIVYGTTEISTITFSTRFQDSPERRAKTVGRVMSHVRVKVVNLQGQIVHLGERGEHCISGYALQEGYLNNEAKTHEVIKHDHEGTLWMYAGDGCIIGSSNYCQVTGRIKDIITRAEIENRLVTHTSISEASAVGIEDAKYGEVISCFLKVTPNYC